MAQFPMHPFGSHVQQTGTADQHQQPQPGLVGHTTGHGLPQFLPEYLLGDPISVTTSVGYANFLEVAATNARGTSRTAAANTCVAIHTAAANTRGTIHTARVHSHRLWSSNLNDSYHHQSPAIARNRLSSAATLNGSQSTTPARPNRSAIGGVEKHGGGSGGGPPTQGLFDGTLATSLTPNNKSVSFVDRSSSFLSNSSSCADVSSAVNSRSPFDHRSNVSTLSPAQLDPFYTQGESLKADDELDGTWVTVFGFPPSSVSFILQQFSQYGNIIEHKMSGGDNFIHLHYGSRIQAKKALCKNGKIFCGNMMIGVTSCIHKDVMSESMKENVSTMARSPLTFSLRNRPSSGLSRTPNGSTFSGMRPLSQAYSTAASEHAVASGSSVPQKQGGVVNKAMEYVFGW